MARSGAGPRGFSDEVVKAKTGRTSAEWYARLDAWGAAAKGHTLTARHLRDVHGVSAWWAQAVTIRYEYERGLR